MKFSNFSSTLGASDEQLDCPFVYASAKNGVAALEISDEMKDMKPLFETILDYIPAPEGDPEAPTQVLISTIDYNEYVGRIGVGKVDNGTIAVNQDMVVVNHHDPDKQKKVKISKLYEFDGLQKVEVKKKHLSVQSWQFQVSLTFPSVIHSAHLKIRHQFRSRRFLNQQSLWISL